MPFDTPSLPALITRAGSDIEGSNALARSDAAVLARTHSGATYGLYEYLRWQFAQLFPDTAEEEMLLRHGHGRGVHRKQPTVAAGSVLFTGSAGAAVPAGTRLVNAGVLYEVIEGVSLPAAGKANAQVAAVEPGAAGNLAAGSVVDLVSPVLGVNSTAVVGAEGITGGTDLEPLEDYRLRVLERFRQVPHGGSGPDYVAWAKDQPGVTRAWVKRNLMGPGTVGVFVVNDARPGSIRLSDAELEVVKAGIEASRPVTAELYLLSPELVPVHYKLDVMPDTPSVRAGVERSLQELHERESALGATLLHTHMAQAISNTEGEHDHVMHAPVDDVVPGAVELLVYGGVQWP
jgi:uncharacterized phage protein gp47/JayE